MSLGGKTTETQQIDPDLKAAALRQLSVAENVGRLGFVPYQGATVAGLQPGQIAAMQNTNAGLEAFGLNPTAIPAAGDLSPYAMYQEQLAQMAPGQRAFIDAMFINPMTGQMQAMPYGSGNATAFAQMTPSQMATAAAMPGGGGREGMGMTAGGGRPATSMASIGARLPGGIDTRNPGSMANRMAAAATSKSYGGAPTGGRASKAPPSRDAARGKK